MEMAGDPQQLLPRIIAVDVYDYLINLAADRKLPPCRMLSGDRLKCIIT